MVGEAAVVHARLCASLCQLIHCPMILFVATNGSTIALVELVVLPIPHFVAIERGSTVDPADVCLLRRPVSAGMDKHVGMRVVLDRGNWAPTLL